MMKTERIGSRGVMLTLEESESPIGDFTAYLIVGEHNIFLCDTHLGPESMDLVKNYLQENKLDKPLVVFLSHSDWDHIWGACAFPDSLIIAHEKCAARITTHGGLDLQRYAQHQRGRVQLVNPRLTFDSRMAFPGDGVEFIYAPGHTADSAICYDRREKIAYVGDLVERPEPVVGSHDLETYIETLENLRGLAAKTIITSHSGRVDEKDIEANIQHIRKFQDIALSEPAGEGPDSDETMIRKIYTLLMYEDAIEQTTGETFDNLSFQRELWKSLDMDYLSRKSVLLRNVGYEELKLALESYMAGL